MSITWFTNEQQVNHIRINFDVEFCGIVHLHPTDIDKLQSQAIGQNRIESELHQETVERMARLAKDGVPFPRVLVWKPNRRAARVVVLDGNHRLAMAFNQLSASAEAILITCEEVVAQHIAQVVNTQHGRTAMTHDYMAMMMRIQREQGLSNAQIGQMWGFTEQQVGTITRRDEQADRLRRLFPARTTRIKETALDAVAGLEDAHLVALGEVFLDAPKAEQMEAKHRILETPSADRATEVQRQAGWLQAKREDAKKIRPTPNSRRTTELQAALTRLVRISDIPAAFYQSSDAQKAKMADQLGRVLPALQQLSSSLLLRKG